jgi:hypothetical protein
MNSSEEIYLGSDHYIRIAVWDPDLSLNPTAVKYKDSLPLNCSGIIRHKNSDGNDCEGVITFDSKIAREVMMGPFWEVESWDPLTLSPSILCSCGDHGFIKQGKWVKA